MAKLLKLRRGTTSQHSSFTGAEGEVTVDTTKDTLVVHDGSTAGGVPLAKESANLSLIDEDNMASNSNTRPPSQQSVKAYVDAGDAVVPTTITVADESSDTTCFPLFVTAATGDLAPKSGSNITFNSSTGLLSTSTISTTGNVTVGGDLQVNGTTTTVNSATLNVTDKNIVLAKSAANDAAADGGGITIESGNGDKTWNWVDATDAWTSSEHIHIPDNKKILIGGASGTVDGCELYHNGSDSYITNTGTGNLIIKGDDVHIQGSNGENMVNCNEDGSVDISYNNVKKFETTTAGVTVTGTVSDSKGDLRKIIQNTQGSTYTLVGSDAGKHILASGAVTIPNSIFAAGEAVTIINNTSGNLTLTASIGTLYNTADGATGNRTLATRGMATILFTAATVGYISGAGLS